MLTYGLTSLALTPVLTVNFIQSVLKRQRNGNSLLTRGYKEDFTSFSTSFFVGCNKIVVHKYLSIMGRIRHNKDAALKNNLKGVKNGSVAKSKNPKYKYTPAGKVVLVKNKSQNMDKYKKNIENDVIKKPQKSETLNISSQKQVADKQNKVADKKKLKQNLQDSIENKENSFNDTIETPDIFGTSLADDTDSDDEEFVENEEEDVSVDGEEEEEEEDEDDDDDDDDSEDSDESKIEEGEDVSVSSDPAQADANSDDDSDDPESEDDEDDIEGESEDDEEIDYSTADSSAFADESDDDVEDEEDIEDEEDYSIDDFEEMSVEGEEDEDDDDDEDEDEDESDDDTEYEEEANGSSLGLKALLGNSLVDDDDDEDFEGTDEDDEDEEISDDAEEDEELEQNTTKSNNQEKAKSSEKKKEKGKSVKDVKGKKKILTPEEEELKIKRTIFIGNVPRDVNEKQLRKVFAQFGPIESMRIRGIAPNSPTMKKKVAAQKKQMHLKLKSIIAYITYRSEASARKALSMNGNQFEGHYLRVDVANKSKEKNIDQKKAVFLGNLSLTIDENSVWEHFKKCGSIESVSIVRDRNTRLGKGFGYVNFKTEDAVTLALELDGTELKNRAIRVKRYVSGNKKPKLEAKKRSLSGESKQSSSKKFKKVSGDAVTVQSNKAKKQTDKSDKSFQGQKAHEKKSKKSQKMGKKQKTMAAKFAKDKK